MPVAPAFHPYFVSPYGDTFVEVEGEGRIHSFLKSDEKVQKKIMFQNLSQKWRKESKRIIVRIPGLGSILMILDGFAEMKKGGINIWREKSSYICVEPVSCFSGDFERGDSPFLAEGTSADLGCTYRFSPNPDDVFEN